MLPLTYYFWSGYKKSWYVRWKLDRAEYDKKVRVEWMDSNVFVRNLVDNILEDQKSTIRDAIDKLESEKELIGKELTKIKSSKWEEENRIKENFIKTRDLLEEEKSREEQNLIDNTILDPKQLKSAKEMFSKLLEQLWTYSEQAQKWVKDQSEKLLQHWKDALKHNIKLTSQEIKDNILPKETIKETNKKSTTEPKKKLWKSLWYLIFLCCMCCFDIFLWYWVATDIFDMYEWQLLLDPKILAFLVALFVIPLAIGIIHFSSVWIWWEKNKRMTKFFWELSVLLTICIVLLYVFQSTPQLLIKIVWSDFWNALVKKPEFLFRAFLIPSLFAWEVIIDLIDRDWLLDYFGIWKNKSRNAITKLINNAVFFLKSKKLSLLAKEEKKSLTALVLEMEKENVPAINEIRKNISEIQIVLDPIFDTQSKKIEQYNEKITQIKTKLDNNLTLYNNKLKAISEKYDKEIAKYEDMKRVNEAKINKHNHDYNQAVIDVKEWVLIWLVE